MRKLLNEVIPQGKSEADTNFLDIELDDLTRETGSIYAADSAGWAIKAGLLQDKTESYSVGQEKYDMTSLKDQLSHALAMSEKYAAMAKSSGGSMVLKITKPEVL